MNLRLIAIALIGFAAAAAASTKQDGRPPEPAAQPLFGQAQAQALANARCRAMFGEGEAVFKEKIGPVWVFRTRLGYAGTPGPDISILPTSSAPDMLIDPLAPAYFARAVAASKYVALPVYDFGRRALLPPVVVRDHALLEQLARIFARAVLQPTSHILAITAGGPVIFYGANNQPMLKLERFANVVRLDTRDYRVDQATSAALTEWFKRADRSSSAALPADRQP